MPENAAPTPSAPVATLNRAAALHAVGDEIRWRILAELGDGGMRMVVEMADRIGRSREVISKHCAVLKRAGLVVTNRAGLYSIPKEFLPSPGTADYGFCVLRLRE